MPPLLLSLFSLPLFLRPLIFDDYTFAPPYYAVELLIADASARAIIYIFLSYAIDYYFAPLITLIDAY